MSEDLYGHSPRQRRIVGLVAALLIVGTLALAIYRHSRTGDLSEHRVEEGLSTLSRAIQTRDAARFSKASRSFKDAASRSYLDGYPAFLIIVTERLDDLRSGEALERDEHTQIGESILARDWEQARRRVEESFGDAPERRRQRRYYLRLIDELKLRH